MKRYVESLIGFSLILVLLQVPLFSQEKPDSPKFTQAFNVNPLGLFFGSYGGNYEILLAQVHGIVAEGSYTNAKATTSSGEVTSTGWTAALHYRWHWSRAMESGFLGVFVRYASGNGIGIVSTTSGGTTSQSSFDATTTASTVGLNVGKRWVWDSGVNIVFRIGYGYTNLNLTTKSGNGNAVNLFNDIKPVLQVLAGIDAELSLGYAY